MSKIITSDNGIELEVCSLGIAVVNHEEETETWARLTDVQRVELAAALDPGRRGLHVRLDNQAATLATYRRERDEALRKKGEAFDRAVRAERERDEAQMERADALRERDAAVARADQADREREEIADQFATFRADIVAEAVKARESAVTHADVEKALRASTNDVFQDESYPHMADAICDLFGIEAEQAEDPVESRARELYRAATPDARWETVADEYRRIAAHVLEQEAGSYA